MRHALPEPATAVPGSPENLTVLEYALAPWACCGRLSGCLSPCRADELSEVLSRAYRLVVQRRVNGTAQVGAQPCPTSRPGCDVHAPADAVSGYGGTHIAGEFVNGLGWSCLSCDTFGCSAVARHSCPNSPYCCDVCETHNGCRCGDEQEFRP